MKPLRVTRVEVVDIKGARQVTLYLPEKEPVHKIGGPNGGGKTSGGPDAFWLVMAKASEHPPDALRHGASKGHAKLTFSNGMTAIRRLSRNKSPELVVTAPDGKRMGAPQSVLDELYKHIGWDLADILRLSDKELAKRVKELAGIDWAALDAEAARVYSERTIINRDVDKARALLDAMPEHADAPDEPVDTEALMAELQRRLQHNGQGDDLQRALEEATEDVEDQERHIAKAEAELLALQLRIDALRGGLADLERVAQAAQLAAEEHEPADVAEIEKKLAKSRETNAAVLAKRQRAAKAEELQTLEAESAKSTARLKAIEAEKQRQLEGAQLPVEGLSFADDGLRYQGVLLSQLSDAQRIRISAAIGIALNPRLPTVICRHGAHLTRESLAALEDEVAQRGGQAIIEHPWLEDKECTAVIREGLVVGGRQLELGK